MKSYTDLEQSRKLTNILPIESADMRYGYIAPYDYSDRMYDGGYDEIPYPKDFLIKNPNFSANEYDAELPCWSFTALFGVIPQINDWITPHGHKNDKLSQFEPKLCKIWEHSIIPSYKVTYGNGLSTDIYDNPVDAAFEMVLKLHELGLL